MKSKLTLAAAIGAAALALPVSHAGATVTAATDDLLLAFQATGGTGSTINLEVDLGNFASPLTSINLNADLTADYGANWATRTDLFWAVIGGNNTAINGLPADTLFVSSPDSAGQGTSAGLAAGAASSQLTVANDLNSGYALFNSTNATAGNTNNSVTVDNSTTGSYGATRTALSNEFGTDAAFEQGVNQASESSDFWELKPGTPATRSSTDINFGTLSSNGVFTVGAVPEPSTWASVVLGAATLIGLRRRRTRA